MDSCSFFPQDPNPEPVAAVQSNRQYKPDSVDLRDWTTLGVGGPAAKFVKASSEDEIVEAVRAADEAGEPVLMLGGGSNLVVSDEGFSGTVVHDMRSDVKVEHDSGCGGVVIRVSAGMEWDQLVALAVQNDWSGLEALSGIPGTVGAAPVQNIGAYGQEVADTLSAVRVYDRLEGRRRTLFLSDVELGYRTSILKRSTLDPSLSQGRVWGPTGRWIVLAVEFQMTHASLSAPVAYAELARRLDVNIGDRVDQRLVRENVLELRRGKSMLLDDDNRNTYSAGSFFTNPIIPESEAAKLPENAPKFPVRAIAPRGSVPDPNKIQEGVLKTSAAWLINNSGFDRGYKADPESNASLSTAHVLALTNRGGATSAEIAALAATVRDGVFEKWGIELVPEPVRVGWDIPLLA
ncbi:MAG: UDP-N-acetylmuramate dehydrogenase [Actinomycetaceae bacterium]|nr:UDP-N-acetylmuramate dehydrogenase [Actinomycetaceae bacterium]